MASSEAEHFHVAIIGGGLCGLALAIALSKRNTSYTIYEARASFTEIGAGINLAPNSLEAFKLIDPTLGDVIFDLATRNPPGREDIWLSARLGAPTEQFEDSRLVVDIDAPPTGNTTLSRNELLRELATRIPPSTAHFNKKLTALDQRPDDSKATLTFFDGTTATASLVVACDGAHSAVRRLIVGPDNPAATPHYSHAGAYRAVFPMARLSAVIGAEIARSSQVWAGPGGYVIMYPINGGQDVNVGFWTWRKGDWEHEGWVVDRQREALGRDFAGWGETVRRMVGMMGEEETQFWGSFHHVVKPERYFERRVVVVGDASHSMGPHQGQGAAQSMEDAYILAQVIQDIAYPSRSTTNPSSPSHSHPQSTRIQAALTAYTTIRRPRFERVLDTSHDAMAFWSNFWRPDLTQDDLERFGREAKERMRWIWDVGLKDEGERARGVMRDVLEGGRGGAV